MANIAGVFIKESSMRRGKPLHAQAREIIYNVYQYFVKESFKFKQYNEAVGGAYFKKVQERVAIATGISRKTVSKILTEAEKASSVVETPATSIKFNTPTKKGKPKKSLRVDLDNFDYEEIRKIVYNFHTQYQELPTLKSLKAKLIETIDFKGSDNTLSVILKEMGFHYVKIQKNKRVLTEKYDVRLRRIEYIEKIKAYRTEGKNIVYIGETTINLPSKSDDNKGHVKKHERIILFHAGNESGFVPGAQLLHQHIDLRSDYETYEKWLRNQLLVNIPKHSVLVIDDNSLNNNKYVETPPNANAVKQDMVNWLKKFDISVDPNLPKPKIHALICRYKENLLEFSVDKLLRDHGHIPVRFPPYHAEMNPLENIWLQLNSDTAKAIKENGNITFSIVNNVLNEKINMLDAKKWKQFCELAIKYEDEYIKQEYVIDEYLDRLMECGGELASDDEYDSTDSVMEVIELDD